MGIKILSNEQEKQLCEDYKQGMSNKTLQLKYGFASKKSIIDKVKKYYPNYQQIINEARKNKKNYHIDLKEIKDQFTAYFIGLMLSDGYIQDNNKFGIQLTDKDVIEFISKVTNKEYKTYEQGDNHKIAYRIIFSDCEQVKNLERYSVVKNKSKIISAPMLLPSEEKYIPYIIRGIIDGDGCVYQTSQNSVAFFIITASYDFAIWIQQVLINKLYMDDIHITIIDNQYYRVETALQTNLFKLITLVYDKEFGMSRKYIALRKMFRDYNKDNLNFF